MIAELSPGLILILGALLVPFLKGFVRGGYMLALPMLAFAHVIGLPLGDFGQVDLLGIRLVTLRVDRLSLAFGYIFLIASFIGVLYTLYHDDWVQHVAGLIYAGSAIGAVFAGDLVTLFLYWEGTAIASVFLIWASRSERSFDAGMRYLLMQVGSGVLLLSGVIIHYHTVGSVAFGHLGLVSTATWLIFLGIAVKSAFPFVHTWLQDAYPEATPGGTVLLSVFTTKLAIYALARGYAGTEILVPIGLVMAVFPIFYALVENDLRRVLAYSLIHQLGFMVVGVGIGTELALNGAVAHAIASVLYQALLFMAVGAVLVRTGTAKASELGGLYRSMPWTTTFCLVGAACISSVPLFSGFVTKSLTLSAAMGKEMLWVWLVLLAASAGAILHSGLRVPIAAFFGTDSGKRCEEAPAPMLVGMALAAAASIGMGLWPAALYAVLPFKVAYAPYTVEHVVTQLQILAFAALAFALMWRSRWLPRAERASFLDTNWLYRWLGSRVLMGLNDWSAKGWGRLVNGIYDGAGRADHRLRRYHAPTGDMGRSWPTGTMAFWTTIMLGAYLLLAALG